MEEKKERKLIIALFENITQKAALWCHYKATFFIATDYDTEEITLVVSKK